MCYQNDKSHGNCIQRRWYTFDPAKMMIVKHRNHPVWKQIRKEMMSGIDPEICKLCTNEETNGIGSKRQWTPSCILMFITTQ